MSVKIACISAGRIGGSSRGFNTILCQEFTKLNRLIYVASKKGNDGKLFPALESATKSRWQVLAGLPRREIQGG